MNSTSTHLSPAELAAQCINQTNKSVFLTGKAGTGKTTFLREISNDTYNGTSVNYKACLYPFLNNTLFSN